MHNYMISHASKKFKGNMSIEEKIKFTADIISLPFLLKMMSCCHLLERPVSERGLKGTLSKDCVQADWFKPEEGWLHSYTSVQGCQVHILTLM
jgi:hypothetical protein